MVATIPSEAELLGFFGVEPAVLEPGKPWVYNTIVFNTEFGGDKVECKISPGFGEISVKLNLICGAQLNAALSRFDRLVVNTEGLGQALVATRDKDESSVVLMFYQKVRMIVTTDDGPVMTLLQDKP